MFKKTIKSAVESAAASSVSGARLVINELQGRKLLPSALFKILDEYARLDSHVTEVRRYLDNTFRIGAVSWIRIGAGLTRPKYSTYGDNIRQAMYSHFGQPDEHLQRQDLVSYIRVVSGLIGYLRLNVTDADYAFFKRASLVATDSHAIDCCAALLIVLAGFGSHTAAQDVLTEISSAATSAVASRVDCLLACFQTNHVKEVNDFVASTLAMDFAYPRERLFFIKDAVQHASDAYFSGSDIARRLLAIPPGDTQHGTGSSALYREAILFCIQGELFQRGGVDVREWVTQSIFAANASLASNYGLILKAYVNAIFASVVVTPVPETLLWRAFSPGNTANDASNAASPSQVLFLLYLLYYCERLQDQPKVVGQSVFSVLPPNRGSVDFYASASAKPRNSALGELTGTTVNQASNSSNSGTVWRGEYSDQLLDSLPVAWILQRVSASAEYSPIWPELLAMSTTQFPDQLETVSVLQRELAADATQTTSRISVRNCQWLSCIGAERDQALEKGVPSILRAAEDFERLPVSARMKNCCEFSERICRLAILRSDSTELTACVRQAWLSLHALNPHLVSVATVNAWRSAFEMSKPLLAPQDLWLDPLVMFRSDPRVFESPSLVDIFLTILAEFLMLSRTNMRRVFALRQKEGGALKKTHLSAILQLQEAASLQMLIETAKASLSDKARHLIFEFIHARFLEQRTTQKLLHFQAYDVVAINDMVSFVPSMHACSEFIPELLMQSAPRQQLFAIKLAAAVLENVPPASRRVQAAGGRSTGSLGRPNAQLPSKRNASAKTGNCQVDWMLRERVSNDSSY
ncbi:hypothetical protein IWW38_001052 [Coemansia aciculifera]|uniref:Uncharacterized protein n=1 Tax=Coemansia aciculifera TaxID=417176 RepID=A0ACC1M7F8_9FUNG|nr:hypothetical protein IWW38_001052 [Coemansia aciculifera]